ncbi:MAG: PHP domain-containing protein [Clostridia bacterium]|nr:PHP domain-containing protein [Clostridia bacterium]
MEYIYDLHVHSSECSGCACTGARDMVRAYIDQGIYTGIVFTNHFGAPPVGKSWEDHVTHYWNNYLEAKEEGEKADFQVFFGFELGYGYAQEIIVYGIDKAFLLANPDLCAIPPEEVAKRVQAYGGFVSHAHPYRKRAYVPEVVVHMDFTVLDGMEIYNAGNREVDDAAAVKKCTELGLIPTAGSDRHGAHEFIKKPFGGIKLNRRVTDYKDLISALKNREHSIWHKGDYIFF